MTARALCVGVGSCDPKFWGGWSGPLAGCEPDARALSAHLLQIGYEVRTLLTREATHARVLDAVRDVAARSKPGDIFVWTNSSHGSSWPNTSPDPSGVAEKDDQTICLHDYELFDDEAYLELCNFPAGVRIVCVTDNCHGATSMRAVYTGVGRGEVKRARSLPPDIRLHLKREYGSDYAEIRADLKERRAASTMKATGVMLGACMDSELALDLGTGGMFTTRLLEQLRFEPTASYARAMKRVREACSPHQTPQITWFGERSPAFEAQPVFGPNAPVDAPVSASKGLVAALKRWFFFFD